MKFRPHLPSDCPPDDAIPTSGVVYRLAVDKNFGEKEFLSFREINPDRDLEGISECVMCGISVYTDIEAVKKMLSRVPAKRRKHKKFNFAFKAHLTPKMGKMKNTPSNFHKSHHTWWFPYGEKPWEIFKLVDLSKD
ncbi:MAG: hypothetical protein LCI00_29075 [Chloroflexi bacterium]|nr:hypothetical protein [Chloroflexota bacterium]